MSFPDEETLVWAKNKFGVGAGGDGESISGGNIVVFDSSKLDEYEKVAGNESEMIKLSDDVLTLNEIYGGCFGITVTYQGQTETYFYPINDAHLNNIVHIEEQGVLIINFALYSVSGKFSEQLGVSPGLYINADQVPADDSEGSLYLMLAWGFE